MATRGGHALEAQAQAETANIELFWRLSTYFTYRGAP
jgi:hypothetical protein